MKVVLPVPGAPACETPGDEFAQECHSTVEGPHEIALDQHQEPHTSLKRAQEYTQPKSTRGRPQRTQGSRKLTTRILKHRVVNLARILGGDALEAFLRSAAYFSAWAHRFCASSESARCSSLLHRTCRRVGWTGPSRSLSVSSLDLRFSALLPRPSSKLAMHASLLTMNYRIYLRAGTKAEAAPEAS